MSNEERSSLTAGRRLHEIIAAQSAALARASQSLLAEHSAESVHAMRVSARRIRTALRLYDGVLSSRYAATLARELRWIANALGRVRDLDRQIEMTQDATGQLLSVEPATLDPIVAELAQRRRLWHDRLEKAVRSARYARMAALLQRCVERWPQSRSRRAHAPMSEAGVRAVRRARKKLRAAADVLDRSSSAAALHEVRLRAKRMRYAVEFLQTPPAKPSRRLIEALIRAQDVLGDHQDHTVALEDLKKVLASGTLSENALRAAAELAQIHAQHCSRLRQRVPSLLQALRGKAWKRWKKAASGRVGRAA